MLPTLEEIRRIEQTRRQKNECDIVILPGKSLTLENKEMQTSKDFFEK